MKYFVFLLFFPVILFISACHLSDRDTPHTFPFHNYSTSCHTDSDCVLVSENCCSCNSGGASIAINKSEESAYNRDHTSWCSKEEPICPAVYRCGEFRGAQCDNSKCVVIKGSPQL